MDRIKSNLTLVYFFYQELFISYYVTWYINFTKIKKKKKKKTKKKTKGKCFYLKFVVKKRKKKKKKSIQICLSKPRVILSYYRPFVQCILTVVKTIFVLSGWGSVISIKVIFCYRT